MKALSILQPYAWLIVTGRKDIENRTWSTGFRGKVFIHAGKTYAKWEYADDAERYENYPARDAMIGGIVGVATIVDCVKTSSSIWFNGPYGFVLRDARPLPFTPWRGQLGFFDVPEHLMSSNDQISGAEGVRCIAQLGGWWRNERMKDVREL